MNNKNRFSREINRLVVASGVVIAGLSFVLAPVMVSADTLNRQLELGMRGTDVSDLQVFLAKDATLYPQGLITGYFGFLTKSAVSNFQVRNGLPSVGRVGPQTLPVLNAQMAAGMTSTAQAPVISTVAVGAGRTNANIAWNTNEFARGVVYYSTTPLVTYERANSVDVSGMTTMTDSDLHTSQNVSLQNLQPNTVYYYLVYTTDQAGNVSVSWPATFQTTN